MFWEGEAEGAEGDAEFVVVEVLVAVEVEESELLCLEWLVMFDLHFLFLFLWVEWLVAFQLGVTRMQ